MRAGVRAQRTGAFHHKDHATMAAEPGVFAQVESHQGRQGHSDLPLSAREQKETERNNWDVVVTPLRKIRIPTFIYTFLAPNHLQQSCRPTA